MTAAEIPVVAKPPGPLNARLEQLEPMWNWEAGMTNDQDSEHRAESRRILDRVSREAQSGGHSAIDRATRRARDHVTAADVDRDDWVEYWGTRIGRTLGLLLLVGLIVWLVLYLAQGE
jgi:hypothetical protein